MEVLILLLVQVLVLTPTNANAANQTSPIFPLPPNCTNKCGDIAISYPFGIGTGCFRPGFEVTCDHSSRPPKLFMIGFDRTYQITSIGISVSATSGINIMPSKAKNYTATWRAPQNGPYSLLSSNSLTIVGCGILVELTDTNKTLGWCVTLCESEDSLGAADGSSCVGTGCCQIQVPYRLSSYMFRLTRVDVLNRLAKDYDVKAFMSSDYYTFKTDDVYSSRRLNGTRVNVLLDWNIPYPQTCKAAKKNRSSYACIAERSYCNEIEDFGYYCTCSSDASIYPYNYRNAISYSHYRSIATTVAENPYIPHGCPKKTSITNPSFDCQTKCGNIEIYFPFGLKQGCYRNTYFKLFCTIIEPTTLLFNYYSDTNNTYEVDKILIDKGQLRVDTTKDTIKARYMDIKPFFYNHESEIFDWVIEYKTCDQAKKDKDTYACVSENSHCENVKLTTDQQGYRCTCNNGFEGNPYLIHGCKDIIECDHHEMYKCKVDGHCLNTHGSYMCCYYDTPNPLCSAFFPPKKGKQSIASYIGIGLGGGFFFLLLAISLAFCRRVWHKNVQMKMRQKYFHQNHGLLLQQLISSNEDITEKTKIFQLGELEKATSNFDQSRIVGRGGHGTVFKGLLLDQRVVAIKKSKLTMKKEIDQFINEVIILSRINHRNIIKLFGCCLETEVPLLVFEFISNGTLHEHLHKKEYKSTLSWEDRLRIASETAGALSYLHSAASISIFHRDVKSTNVLLDEYLTVKISDFGASRSLPIDKIQVTTVVQGTYGYLDPEYHYTSQLTEKSDVYSFGVILVELLTGALPISFTRDEEERNLSVHFLRAIKENSILELVETRVKEESTSDELGEFIHLAENCLRLRGEDRPTMKEVEVKLQNMRLSRKKTKVLKQVPDSLASEILYIHDEISIQSEEHMVCASYK